MTSQRANQTKTSEHDRTSQASATAKSAAPAMHPMLHLQQQVGNQAVGRLIQAKLTVGEPNDVYEQEADLRGEAAEVRSNGTELPSNLKAGTEALSGFSLDDVRVHYNSSKPAGVGALAYAQGTDIYVAPGQEKYLPHEAWHVVQQMQGRVKPTKHEQGTAVNDEKELENEADEMGAQALQSGFADHSTIRYESAVAMALQKEELWTSSNEVQVKKGRRNISFLTGNTQEHAVPSQVQATIQMHKGNRDQLWMQWQFFKGEFVIQVLQAARNTNDVMDGKNSDQVTQKFVDRATQGIIKFSTWLDDGMEKEHFLDALQMKMDELADGWFLKKPEVLAEEATKALGYIENAIIAGLQFNAVRDRAVSRGFQQ